MWHGCPGWYACRRGRGGRFPSGSEKYEDESFVLPALIRFNGEPFVDDDGRLLYKFPDLQVGTALSYKYVKEEGAYVWCTA